MPHSSISRKNEKYKRWDLLVGCFVGVILVLAVSFGVKFFKEKNSITNDAPTQIKARIDTIHAGDYTLEIKQRNEILVKERNEIFNEKIKSFNDRLGDMYLSLTIIVTLLLAIVVSVYFKTETEVSKHMNNNYSKYKDEIEEMNAKSQEMLNQIQTNLELSEGLRQQKQQQQVQQPPQTTAQTHVNNG